MQNRALSLATMSINRSRLYSPQSSGTNLIMISN